jgi:3-deoxy-D-manno-octulosonic-acid transferase
MMRALYSWMLLLAQPLLRRKLARRGVEEPGYLEAVEERFGHYASPRDKGYVWLHAVSLGETRAAAILIAQLRERLPGMRLLLTHGTATGRAEGRKLLRDGDAQAWQPWDTPAAVHRFLAHFSPRAGILMETEVWPNLAAACARAGVPLVLANARLSAKSLRQAQRLAWLSLPAYRSLAAVWAQTEADAQRLRLLGAPVQGVFGNLKFDAAPDAAQWRQGRAWREAIERPVLMFASTREGEETLLLQVLQSLETLRRVPRAADAVEQVAAGVQWLIVPRHPQRFEEVAALAAQHGFSVSRRSEWAGTPPSMGGAPATIWLGDSLGEMALYYAMSDVALLGGSFAPFGGQNLIEAAACGCPVVMGPSTFNFAEAAELAEEAGASRRVGSLEEGVGVALAMVAHDGRDGLDRTARAATDFAAAHRGAVHQTVDAVAQILSARPVR